MPAVPPSPAVAMHLAVAEHAESHCDPMRANPRWARCPVDEQLHLLAPADVQTAGVEGYAYARCGRLLIAEGLTLSGQSMGLCMDCLAAGTTS